MSTAIHRQVEAARRGENPHVVCRARSGWVVFSPHQYLRGYCLLLPDPVAASLNTLDRSARAIYLDEMATLGDVLLELTGATRINYEILGNLEPALHAHVIPRYASEPEAHRTQPIWLYPEEIFQSVPFDAERERELREGIRNAMAGSD